MTSFIIIVHNCYNGQRIGELDETVQEFLPIYTDLVNHLYLVYRSFFKGQFDLLRIPRDSIGTLLVYSYVSK